MKKFSENSLFFKLLNLSNNILLVLNSIIITIERLSLLSKLFF